MCSVISVTTPGAGASSSPSGGGVGDLVGVGDQRDPLEEVGQAGRVGLARLDLGRIGRGPGHRVLGELPGHGHELGEVLHPGLVLGVLGLLELLEVAAAGQRLLQHHVDALVRRHHLLQLLDHVDEALDRLERAGGDARGVLGPLQRLPERDPVALGNASTHASARSPMPRLGVLSTRRSDTESAGFASTRR